MSYGQCRAEQKTPKSVSRCRTLRCARVAKSLLNLVAEPMEPIHAELLRLATELEAVKGQVITECNALRDLFARTTTALSSSGSQHDRRLNHKEAGNSVEAVLTMVTLPFGWRALRQSYHVMDRVVRC